MPEFSIKVGKKTYKVEASTKKEAETKIMEYVSKTNKKAIKEQEAKKEKSDKQRKAKKRKSDKERKTKNKGSDMNGYYMKKVMVDYTVEYTDGDYPMQRKPHGEGWEPAGGIAVAPHRGKGVLGTTGRYTWAQAWVQYKYVKTEM